MHRRGGYRDPESQAFIESWFGKLKQRLAWRSELEHSTTPAPRSTPTPTATTTGRTAACATARHPTCGEPGKMDND
jgi:hypothetical protein